MILVMKMLYEYRKLFHPCLLLYEYRKLFHPCLCGYVDNETIFSAQGRIREISMRFRAC